MKRVVAVAALMCGCADEASVGDLTCATSNNCQELALSEPLSLTQVATTGLTTLAASWTKPELKWTGGLETVGAANGPDGSLWTFRGGVNDLLVTKLDANGSVLGEQHVAPPPSKQPVLDALTYVTFVDSHPLGPVAVVQWAIACDPRAGVPGDCASVENLVFSTEPALPPVRLGLEQLGTELGNQFMTYRAQDGLIIPYGDEIRKVDLNGKPVWEQSLTGTVAHDLISTGPVRRRAQREQDGSLSFSRPWNNGPDGQLEGSIVRVPANGDAPQALEYSFAANPALALAPDTSFESLQVDARGRRLITVSNATGDALVLRVEGTSADGFQFVRDGFTSLIVRATAVDPAGTMYLTFDAGGREPASQHAVLCAVPQDGSPTCNVVAERPFALYAPAAGVVYGGGPSGLSRYDF